MTEGECNNVTIDMSKNVVPMWSWDFDWSALSKYNLMV